MISLYNIALILCAHFLADFVFQFDKMANNKSKSFYWLFVHISTYTLVLFSVMTFALNDFFVLKDLIVWSLINFIFHFFVDLISSKISSYFYKKNRIHAFFITVGFDQMLHFLILFYTFIEFYK